MPQTPPPPAFDGHPTRAGGRATSRVQVVIEGWIACTGCGISELVNTYTETDPAHVPDEIIASQYDANSHALVHAKTCAATPEGDTRR